MATRVELRAFHARLMAAAARTVDPRFEKVFAAVAREDFLPASPWQFLVGGSYISTPDGDPSYVYQNVLVALRPDRGINNGEPFMHADWIGSVCPQPGDVISHIGTGYGYYTAILGRLCSPGGHVHAFEIDVELAGLSERNLANQGNVTVIAGDATVLPIPKSDLIYVNAGVVRPPVSWLEALSDTGRMIFPWRPIPEVGLSILLTKTSSGYLVSPRSLAFFIPCIGASGDIQCRMKPTIETVWQCRSLWLTSERKPDSTAVAVYDTVWFSREELGA